MAVRKRGRRWVVDFFYRDEAGRRRRFRRSLGTGVTSRRQAEAEETRLRAEEILQERARLSGEPTGAMPEAAFSGFARKWLELHAANNVSPGTYSRYESMLRVHLVPFFGDTLLTNIRVMDVERFKAENRKWIVKHTGRPLGPKTVNEHINLLSSVLNTAIKWGYLRTNPCSQVKRLPVPDYEWQFYDAEQTRTFLRTAKNLTPGWHSFFMTGFKAGLRMGEMLALRWGDIDFDRSRLHIQQSWHRGSTTLPKWNKKRWVSIPRSLAAALRSERHLRGELVFCQDDGRHLTRDMLKHPYSRVMRAAGLPTIRVHDMRHSYASQLVMAGVPMKAVQELLGHKDIKTTMRYAHLSPTVLDAHVQVLDDDDLGQTSEPPPPLSVVSRDD